MCRLLGWVSSSPLTLREVLGEESYIAFGQLSRIHADGWGLAVLNGDDVALRRSTTRADTDPHFADMAGTLASAAAVAHLRWASPGLPVELHNAHPFRHGRAAFAHNGLIQPFDRLDELLPAPWRDRMTGTTDSEHYFLAVLAELERAGDDDVPAAVGRVIRRLDEQYSASSLNAMLLTPEALYVINCHDPDLRPVMPPEKKALTVAAEVEATEEEAIYFGLRYRRTDSSVVVASSGFAQPEGGGWQQIPNNSVLVVKSATLAIQDVPLDVRLGRSTAALQNLGTDLR